MNWSPIFLALVSGLVVRWAVSLHPYSGAGRAPMYGDFEAQRHWMEITYNLPISDWYSNTSDNDLLYWGLDYPPLTAYHSWICGYVANKIDPDWVSLHTSRGIETQSHKLFMRYTVLVADLLVYLPALLVFCVTFLESDTSQVRTASVFAVMSLQPAIILIDHGHFQYNCVSLGLALCAVIFIGRGQDVLASVAFCFALNYKQMELYHSFPFFCYLLGVCWQQKSISEKLRKLFVLASSVVLSFLLWYLPFLFCNSERFTSCFSWMPFLTNFKLIPQVIHRIFPVARGLFEVYLSFLLQ
eukprot:m.93223 g.93223  ORF g.93223 m.93223 type:complete len:299 (+) comp36775_c0_seq22:26-922(+)